MRNVRPYFVVLALLAVQGCVLYLYGQPPICTCGHIKFWEGLVSSAETSQQFTDWYTFSHIIHGFLFYMILRYLFPRRSVAWRLAMAVGIEAAWELTENTPMVIEHYRQQALAHGYTGDSILNSLSDTVSMIVGFFLASRLRVWMVVSLAIFFELLTLYFIRDGLTLNVLNLIHVFPQIAAWQSAG